MSCNHCATSSTAAAAGVGAPDIEATRADRRGHPQTCPTCRAFLRADGGCTRCETRRISVAQEQEHAAQLAVFEKRFRAGNILQSALRNAGNPDWATDAGQVLAVDGGQADSADPELAQAHQLIRTMLAAEAGDNSWRNAAVQLSHDLTQGPLLSDADLTGLVEACNAHYRQQKDGQWDSLTTLAVLKRIEDRHGLFRSPLSADTSRQLLVDMKAECIKRLPRGDGGQPVYRSELVRQLAMYALGDTDFGHLPKKGRYDPFRHHRPPTPDDDFLSRVAQSHQDRTGGNDPTPTKLCQKCGQPVGDTPGIAGFDLCAACRSGAIAQCECGGNPSCSICAGDGEILVPEQLPEPTPEMLQKTIETFKRFLAKKDTNEQPDQVSAADSSPPSGRYAPFPAEDVLAVVESLGLTPDRDKRSWGVASKTAGLITYIGFSDSGPTLCGQSLNKISAERAAKLFKQTARAVPAEEKPRIKALQQYIDKRLRDSRRNLPLKPGADLCLAQLEGLPLQDTDLRGADLRGAKLFNADLSNADLSSAIMSDAWLQNTRLHRANLFQADLRNANLDGADLTEASLEGAWLKGADLGGANLAQARLAKADLSGAGLYGADLGYADLRGADLTNADLTEADLTGAEWDDNTVWPRGFNPEEIAERD